MHFKKRFDSVHLSTVDLDGKDVTVTLESVSDGTVADENGVEQRKPVWTLRGKKKKWVCNITNMTLMAAIFGETDDDKWIGHKVTLRGEKVMAFGEMVDGLAVVGSPELTAPLTVRYRMGRKRASRTLQPTGKAMGGETRTPGEEG